MWLRHGSSADNSSWHLKGSCMTNLPSTGGFGTLGSAIDELNVSRKKDVWNIPVTRIARRKENQKHNTLRTWASYEMKLFILERTWAATSHLPKDHLKKKGHWDNWCHVFIMAFDGHFYSQEDFEYWYNVDVRLGMSPSQARKHGYSVINIPHQVVGTCNPPYTTAHLEQRQTHDYYSTRLQPCLLLNATDEVERRIYLLLKKVVESCIAWPCHGSVNVTDAEAFPWPAFLGHHECGHEIVADGILRVLVVQELPTLDPHLMIMHRSGYGKKVGKRYLEKSGCSNIFCLQSNFFHVYEYTDFKWSSEVVVRSSSCQ